VTTGRELLNRTYRIVSILRGDSPFTLILGDDLACVFDNDLAGFECPTRSYSKALALSLHNFNPDIKLPSCLAPFLEVSKRTIGAEFDADVAIRIVTFIEHETVVAVFVTAFILCTETL